MADKEMTQAVGRLVAARAARDNARDAYRLANSYEQRNAAWVALTRAEIELEAAETEIPMRWGRLLQEEAEASAGVASGPQHCEACDHSSCHCEEAGLCDHSARAGVRQ